MWCPVLEIQNFGLDWVIILFFTNPNSYITFCSLVHEGTILVKGHDVHLIKLENREQIWHETKEHAFEVAFS